MGKSLSKWYLPHRVVRIQCVHRYMHSLSHKSTYSSSSREAWHTGSSSGSLDALTYMPSALGSTKITLVWVPPASPPCLCSQSAHLFFCHFDTISDLVLSDISALCSLLQIPSALMPEIISERAKTELCLCVSLCWGMRIVLLYIIVYRHFWSGCLLNHDF